MKVVAFARVSGGMLKIINRRNFDADLLFFNDKDVVITVEKKKKKRTLSQNAYMHLMLQIFADKLNELGNEFTMQTVKDLMKYRFLLVEEINMETGQIIGQRIKDTSECTTTELNDFIEKVIRYAVDEFRIQLPYPNEQLSIMCTN